MKFYLKLLLTGRILSNISFVNISKLIQIFQVIPLSSVDCERNFSKMKLIKAHLRNSLEEDTRELMLISIVGDEIETFNFIQPIKRDIFVKLNIPCQTI